MQRIKQRSQETEWSWNKSKPPEKKKASIGAGEKNESCRKRCPFAKSDGVGARVVFLIELEIANLVVEMTGRESKCEEERDENTALVDRRKDSVTEKEMKYSTDQMRD